MKHLISLDFLGMPNYLTRLKVKFKDYYKWWIQDHRWFLMFILSRFEFIKNLSIYFFSSPEKKYKNTFIVGDYLNVEENCPAVEQLQKDPQLLEIAAKYLQENPVHLSTKLWWSYATEASLDSRLNFAQVFFHYDLIDYRSIQFFFYLTDVDLSSGPHVCILGSHQNKKLTHQLSFFTGLSEKDIINYYGTENLKLVCGKAGLGFIEDPYCFHKGIPPREKNRLLLKIVFGINSYRSSNYKTFL